MSGAASAILILTTLFLCMQGYNRTYFTVPGVQVAFRSLDFVAKSATTTISFLSWGELSTASRYICVVGAGALTNLSHPIYRFQVTSIYMGPPTQPTKILTRKPRSWQWTRYVFAQWPSG